MEIQFKTVTKKLRYIEGILVHKLWRGMKNNCDVNSFRTCTEATQNEPRQTQWEFEKFHQYVTRILCCIHLCTNCHRKDILGHSEEQFKTSLPAIIYVDATYIGQAGK